MTDTTTAAEAEPAANDNTTESATETAKTPRRWKTLTLVLISAATLVVGLGVGGVSGWAISQAQTPQFGNGEMGQFPGGEDGEFPGGDGDFSGGGDRQGPGGGQPGDSTDTDTDTDTQEG